MRNRKPLHLRIRLALVIAEYFCRIVTRPHARAADIQSHFRWMKKIVEQLLSHRRIQPVQGVASGVCKRCTEAEHFLKLLRGIQFNHTSARRSTSPRKGGLRLVAQLPARDTYCDLVRLRRRHWFM